MVVSSVHIVRYDYAARMLRGLVSFLWLVGYCVSGCVVYGYRKARGVAKVTTGTGDTGYTSLLGEQRVPKYHPLPEAFGAVDEATSALGMARAATNDPTVHETILRMQQDLYVLMAELATPPENQAAVGMRVAPEQVAWLDGLEARLKQEVEIPNKFIIPGDSVVGAALDLARTIIRRSERLVARLTHEGAVENPDVLRYLNRLSDAVFILARYIEAKAGGSTQAKRLRDE
jgi:cob(I)alamin adenosyltransferase